MNEYAELPSLIGMVNDGIEVTGITAERIYCALSMPSVKFENLIGKKSNYDSIEWVMRIVVCMSYDQYYIYIESNSHSCFVEFIMTNLISIIPCKIQFSPIISNTRGYYVPQSQQIVIANNAAQFQIIFSTIHEYVHYFLKSTKEDSLNIERGSSETVIEYILSIEEYICNSVAYEVMLNIVPNTISQIINRDMNLMLKDLEKLSKSPFKSLHEKFHATRENIYISPETSTVLSLLVSQNLISDSEKTKAKSKIDSIANFILDKLKTNKIESIDKELLDKKEYAQNGCVILDEKDNTTLYSYLKNNIIPMVFNKDKMAN